MTDPHSPKVLAHHPHANHPVSMKDVAGAVAGAAADQLHAAEAAAQRLAHSKPVQAVEHAAEAAGELAADVATTLAADVEGWAEAKLQSIQRAAGTVLGGTKATARTCVLRCKQAMQAIAGLPWESEPRSSMAEGSRQAARDVQQEALHECYEECVAASQGQPAEVVQQ
jgi:hypothetical protein